MNTKHCLNSIDDSAKLFRALSLIAISMIMCKCEDNTPSISRGATNQSEQPTIDSIPLTLMVLRDGGTIHIQVHGGAEAGGWDLYRATSQDPSIDGKWFTKHTWRKGGGVPLMTEEVLQKMEDLEKILSQAFPDGLHLIRVDRKRLNNLTDSEMIKLHERSES